MSEILIRALQQWKCPSCGGKLVYPMRAWPIPGGKPVVTEVPCKVCGQTGLHPIANDALKRHEEDTNDV